MSHYQAYLEAVGSSDPKRYSSAPAGPVGRKMAQYATGTSVPPSEARSGNLSPGTKHFPHRTASPATSHRSSSPAPVYTPSAQFSAAAALTALSAHAPPAKPVAAPTKSPTVPKSPSAPEAARETVRQQPTIADAQVSKALSHALALLQNASTYHSKRPFSALLLAPDNQSILLSHFSISHIRHAESELARLASDQFSTTYLSHCTLVSTWEPCAMCSGTVYWSGIGRVIYGAGEDRLRELTGSGNEENMTMNLDCRKVLRSGQRDIEVIGPVPEWEEKIVEECRKWWSQHGGSGAVSGSASDAASTRDSVNGVQTHNGHAKASSGSVATTWTGDESVLSSIGEDGEYKADLDIDWMR